MLREGFPGRLAMTHKLLTILLTLTVYAATLAAGAPEWVSMVGAAAAFALWQLPAAAGGIRSPPRPLPIHRTRVTHKDHA